MLAMADRRGRVWASVPGLADRARVSIDHTVEALKKFQSPDKWSRTKLYEGRRIEEIDGGWRILNYDKYRAMRDEEEKREYERQKKRAQRKKEPLAPELQNAAHKVMLACSISDLRMTAVIARTISEYEKSTGSAPEYTAALMIRAYEEYKNAAEFLRFTVGLRKFFGHGLWNNPKLWPIDQEQLSQWRRTHISR